MILKTTIVVCEIKKLLCNECIFLMKWHPRWDWLYRDFFLKFDWFLWTIVGLFFLRRWIWTRLLWFGLVDINHYSASQPRGRSRSRTVTHEFATENRTGFQEKDQGEDGDSWRKSYLFPKIFVTDLQFDQVRFFFNVTEVSIFLLFRHHTTEHAQMVWREARAWKRPTRRHYRNGSWTNGYTHTHVDRQKRHRTKHIHKHATWIYVTRPG